MTCTVSALPRCASITRSTVSRMSFFFAVPGEEEGSDEA
jgi:hypothetical protein